MGPVYKRKTGTFKTKYFDANGKRVSLYLPPAEKHRRVAESITSKIDHLVSRQVFGADPDRDVAEWVAGLSEKLHAKLVEIGLTAPRITTEEPEQDRAPTIKDWTDRYIRTHSAKDGTIEQLEITARSICKHFGDHKRIDTFTEGDAEDFRKWLETNGGSTR